MHNLMNSKVVLGFLSVLLVACSSTPKQPQWLNDPSVDYPSEKYLTAVGEASDRETSSGRARANLSQIFQVAIKDTSSDFSQSIVKKINSDQQIENEQRSSRFVNADARQVLEGTEIIEYWVDPKGKVYSLAVLEKAPANRRFRDSVRGADRRTSDLIDYASKQASNPVVALRALEDARLNQKERDNANRNLTVTSGKGIKASYSSAQVESMIRKALASLQFSINPENDDINSEVESAMASLGIQQNPNSAYRLTSKLDTEPPQKKTRMVLVERVC